MARSLVCLVIASIGFTSCTITKTPLMQVVFQTEYPGRAEAVAQTLDGGYFLTGSLYKGNGTWCPWIGGVRESGDVWWSKVLEGQCGSSLAMAPDGGLLVCGSQWMDYGSVGRVMRVDTEGNEEWTWTYRGTEQVGDQWVRISTHFAGVRPTADGGCIVTGDKAYSAWGGDITLPFDGIAFLIVKFAQGTEQWSQVYPRTRPRETSRLSPGSVRWASAATSSGSRLAATTPAPLIR